MKKRNGLQKTPTGWLWLWASAVRGNRWASGDMAATQHGLCKCDCFRGTDFSRWLSQLLHSSRQPAKIPSCHRVQKSPQLWTSNFIRFEFLFETACHRFPGLVEVWYILNITNLKQWHFFFLFKETWQHAPLNFKMFIFFDPIVLYLKISPNFCVC